MSRATTHSAVLVAAFAATAIINYAFGVAMSWFFTPAQFGVLGVGQSLLLLLALAGSSGFAWTTAHDIAALGVTDGTRRRFRAAWVSNLGLGLGLGGGLWALYALGWIPLGPAYRWVVPLVGITAVLLAARAVVNGAVRGCYQFTSLAVNQVGEVVVKSAAGLAFVLAGAGVAGVIAGFALGSASALAHSLWVTRGARLWQGKGWTDAQVMRATAPLFMAMFGTAMMLNLDILGLKMLTPSGGNEQAGYYQAAVILARTPVYIAQSLNLVLFSYIAGATGAVASQGEGTTAYLRVGLRAWIRLLLPGGLVLALAPEAALSLFFPTRYLVAAPLLRIAGLGGAILALVTLLIAIFQAGGGRRRPAAAAALATAVQIIVLIALVPRWGALGAAFSLLAAGCTALLAMTPLLRAELGVLWPSSAAPIRTQLLRTWLPLAALLLPLWLLPDGGRGAALVKLGASALAYLAAMALAYWWPSAGHERPKEPRLAQFLQMLLGGP
ncbi:MAG: polysaccharide biosynthesis C-terminal domain-containing protein [Anaerolineae bacterium]|nr:polysaccharide biosynthesis C-terminal domain-containing protein [Anaerolineae bacterium]